MLFARRSAPGLAERVRIALWPRRSWSRSMRYVHQRVRRVAATPHAVALGFAIGVFVAFTPFIGLHFALSVLAAWLFGASVLASALGTFIANPVTSPLILASTFGLGTWMLHEHIALAPIDLSDGLLRTSMEHLWPLLKPMALGSIPLGFVAGIPSYFLVRHAVEAYQARRKLRAVLRVKPRSIRV